MTESANHVSSEFQIKQSQKLSLANIPKETRYTVTELPESGYELVNIRKEILNGKVVESRDVYTGEDGISGTVVSDRDNNLIFTNKKLSTDIIVKKVDQNNRNKPLSGAVFKLQRTSGPGTSDYDGDGVSKPGSGEADTAIFKFSRLPDGTYKLTETTPPEGYAGIGNSVTFTVSGGVVAEPSNLPTGVTWDGTTGTFTVKNTESSEGKITIRKEWLDANGEPTEHNGTLDLTLRRWVKILKKVIKLQSISTIKATITGLMLQIELVPDTERRQSIGLGIHIHLMLTA